MKKKLVKAETAQLPAKIEKRLGFEHVVPGDITLPRLKLCQALTPEVQEGFAEQGQFINSLTNFNFGDTLTIVPLMFIKSCILWIPMDDGGGIRCRSFNGVTPAPGGEFKGPCPSCQMHAWSGDTERRKPPECTEYWNFPCIVLVHNDMAKKKATLIDHLKDDNLEHINPSNIVVLSFGKIAMSAGKRMISIAQFTGGDIFETMYRLTSSKKKQGKYTFYVPMVNPGGSIDKKPWIVKLTGLHGFLRPKQLEIYPEGPDDDVVAADVKDLKEDV